MFLKILFLNLEHNLKTIFVGINSEASGLYRLFDYIKKNSALSENIKYKS